MRMAVARVSACTLISRVEPELVDLLVPGPLVGEAQDGRIADQPDAAIAAGTVNRGVQQGYDGAPLGGGEVLGREERECGEVCQRSDRPPVQRAADGVRSVLEK